jgi:hypothetical protein
VRRVIDVRKLAALDLVFHGSLFVLVEFAGALLLAGGLGVLSLRSGLSAPGRPVLWEIVLGAALASIALNYLPLLVHAVVLVRSGTARAEVARELEQTPSASRRYAAQQFLLLVPFAVLVLAMAQALRRRTSAAP